MCHCWRRATRQWTSAHSVSRSTGHWGQKPNRLSRSLSSTQHTWGALSLNTSGWACSPAKGSATRWPEATRGDVNQLVRQYSRRWLYQFCMLLPRKFTAVSRYLSKLYNTSLGIVPSFWYQSNKIKMQRVQTARKTLATCPPRCQGRCHNFGIKKTYQKNGLHRSNRKLW